MRERDAMIRELGEKALAKKEEKQRKKEGANRVITAALKHFQDMVNRQTSPLLPSMEARSVFVAVTEKDGKIQISEHEDGMSQFAATHRTPNDFHCSLRVQIFEHEKYPGKRYCEVSPTMNLMGYKTTNRLLKTGIIAPGPDDIFSFQYESRQCRGPVLYGENVRR